MANIFSDDPYEMIYQTFSHDFHVFGIYLQGGMRGSVAPQHFYHHTSIQRGERVEKVDILLLYYENHRQMIRMKKFGQSQV